MIGIWKKYFIIQKVDSIFISIFIYSSGRIGFRIRGHYKSEITIYISNIVVKPIDDSELAVWALRGFSLWKYGNCQNIANFQDR